MKAIYFALFCASIGIAYATPDGNKPIRVTKEYLGKHTERYDAALTPDDSVQSVKFAYNDIVKKYPNLFISGNSIAYLNKNDEIDAILVNFTMLDVVSKDEACKMFCDILSMFASAMKRYKTINYPLCKNFGIKNIKLFVSFRPAVISHSQHPKIALIHKHCDTLTISRYEENCSKDVDSWGSGVEFVNFYEIWKKYVGKK